MTSLLQYLVSGLSTGAGFALLGIGLVFVFRATGILNFAQGTFSVLGALLMSSLVTQLPGVLAALVAIAAVALFGAAIAPIAFGIPGRTTLLSSLVVTLGIALVASAGALLIWGDAPRTFGKVSDGSWDLGGVIVQPQEALVVGVTLLTTLGLTLLLKRTLIGQALVACADSRRAAQLVGLNLRGFGIAVFAISAALGALAGILLAPLSAVSYDADIMLAINGFAAAALGGLTRISAALVGGLVLGIAEALVGGYFDPQYQLTFALVFLLIVMVIRSQREART